MCDCSCFTKIAVYLEVFNVGSSSRALSVANEAHRCKVPFLGHLWLFCQKSPLCQSSVAYWDACESHVKTSFCDFSVETNFCPSLGQTNFCDFSVETNYCPSLMQTNFCPSLVQTNFCDCSIKTNFCDFSVKTNFCPNLVPISKSDKLKWVSTKIFIGNLQNKSASFGGPSFTKHSLLTQHFPSDDATRIW